jgi:hypothetical protein
LRVKGALRFVPTFFSAAVSICRTTPTLWPLAIRLRTSAFRREGERESGSEVGMGSGDSMARRTNKKSVDWDACRVEVAVREGDDVEDLGRRLGVLAEEPKLIANWATSG